MVYVYLRKRRVHIHISQILEFGSQEVLQVRVGSQTYYFGERFTVKIGKTVSSIRGKYR